MEKDFWQGVRDALPTALGYISIGLACGVVASPYLSPLEMALMSILVYAGAAQFAMISLIAVHSSILNMALTVFLINLRNMLMSLHTSSDFKDASLAHTIGIGSLLTDESYGVYLSEKLKTDRITVPWMHGNNLVGYVVWISATVVGTALGSLLPDPKAFGLDFALVAMFIGIFAAQFQGMQLTEKTKTLLLVLLSVAVSFFLLLFVVAQAIAVLVATLIGCFVGVICDARE
ncbi:AzlC family ABC transporter permease [Streptococcus lactarius]|uniref:AzlC family ABC transporter permease n=1 Tax=Streptococcus lactarius TaxID=684066 RepID=A0A9X1BCU6_9STRE|nr:AzlC family ABC transporter permease [Streptococcus lactarius]MBK4779750.1 branched-chain amino acid transporter AzlC [Streptococcus lactarius]QUB38717.1 AzlC family ABC transporter permease [Streptococcus lactarius]